MRKIQMVRFSLSLLLVVCLMMAALPAVVLATATPQSLWGTVLLDGLPADVDTTIDIYIGDDMVPTPDESGKNGMVTTAGQYGKFDIWADDSRYGDTLTYRVNGNLATQQGVFGLENQIISLTAYSGEQTQHTLTVTVSPMGAGTVNKAPAQPSGGYVEDTPVTLTAAANFGYTFNIWSGVDSSDGDTATITMDSDKAVTASFLAIDPDDITIQLVPGWNVISTAIWLDEDSDRTDEILSGYDLAYRWTGSKFSKLSSSRKWEPLEAFYVHVAGSATATFSPSQEMMAPNDRKLSSNKWALIGPSPIDGTAALTVDEVLAGLNGNWANVIIPGGGYCTSANDCELELPAFGGAWVFVGAEKSRTIVGLYGDMTP